MDYRASANRGETTESCSTSLQRILNNFHDSSYTSYLDPRRTMRKGRLTGKFSSALAFILLLEGDAESAHVFKFK